jgi:hypothetical protein
MANYTLVSSPSLYAQQMRCRASSPPSFKIAYLAKQDMDQLQETRGSSWQREVANN